MLDKRKNMIVYRICERKGDKLLTLFHGINGSRVLPIGEWITAEMKLVTDGSKTTSKLYYSGFHVLKDINECRNFVKKFRRPRDLVMVECEVEDTHSKTHSKHNILLARRMKIIKIIEKLYYYDNKTCVK
jgi:hypothetical protein